MYESISAVIPVYNGESSLDQLYRRLTHILALHFREYEIIMIDDDSKDGSYRKICQLQAADSRVKGIKLAGNYGQQNALMCGFRHAQGEYIVTLDDDLQHLPEEIPHLMEKLNEGYDIVYGIPRERHHQFHRRLGSKVTDLLFNFITDKKPGIRVSSFRIMKKHLLQKIKNYDYSFVYISAIVLQYTDKIGNVVVEHERRKFGSSNYNVFKLAVLFLLLFVYFTPWLPLEIFRSKGYQYRIEDKRGV